ncbi:TonB family protein [Iocasia frigidifontis]|uniref:TonB family protein n=1 Tax=Iocasia fonsfrigidae TaxID=2682810 RepID=A0A8A7KHJ6_9FIRM|nr:energy transducer TonB [Iocasia fonsfrigidae]QTL97614.1 TonB family protein [Iocasia fonsfrigidae]
MSFKGNLNRFISRAFTPVRVSFVLAGILHLLLLSSISGLFAFNDLPEEETLSPVKLNFRVVQTPSEEKEAEKTGELPPVEQLVANSEVVEERKTVSTQQGIEGVGNNQKPSVEEVDRETEVENIVQEIENEPEDDEKDIDQGQEESLKDNIKDDNKDSRDDSIEKFSNADSIAKERDEQSLEVENINNSIDQFPPGIGRPWDESNQEIEVSRKEKQPEESRNVQKDEIKSIDKPGENQEFILTNEEIDSTNKVTAEQGGDDLTKNKGFSYKQEAGAGSEGDKNKVKQKDIEETGDGEIIDLTSGKTAEGVVLPKLSNYKKPVYPEDMRKRGIEGRVILEMMISNQGKVVKVEVKDSSGYKNFDESAKDVVKEWLFTPAGRGGENLACRVLVPVEFRLN